MVDKHEELLDKICRAVGNACNNSKKQDEFNDKYCKYIANIALTACEVYEQNKK